MADKITDTNKAFLDKNTRPSTIPKSPHYEGAPKNTEPYVKNKPVYSKLIDFTGTFPKAKNNPYPLVLRRDVHTYFTKAVSELNSDANKGSLLSDKITEVNKTWTPMLSGTYRTEETAVRMKVESDMGLAISQGSTVGREVSIDLSGYTPSQRKFLDLHMRNNGFVKLDKDGNITNTINGKWEYRGDLEGANPKPDYFTERLDLLSDRRKFDSDVLNTYLLKKAKPSRHSTEKAPDITATLSMKQEERLPAKIMSPRGSLSPTDTKAQQDILTAAINKVPASTVSVVTMPKDKAMTLTAKQEEEILSSGRVSKLTKNVYDTTEAKSFELGVEAKFDMPAQIRIFREEGAELTPAMEAFESSTKGYINCFLLKSMQARREERYFIFQSLYGDITTFFFGERPTVYNFTGALIDTKNQQWFNDFQHYYDNYLRGSQSVLNKTRLFLVYEDQIIEGYILDMTMQKTGDFPTVANMSFDLLLVQRTHINGYKNPIERSRVETTGSTVVSYINHVNSLLTSSVGEKVYAAKAVWNTGSTLFSLPEFDSEEVIKKIAQSDIAAQQAANNEDPKDAAKLKEDALAAAASSNSVLAQTMNVSSWETLSQPQKESLLKNNPYLRSQPEFRQ